MLFLICTLGISRHKNVKRRKAQYAANAEPVISMNSKNLAAMAPCRALPSCLRCQSLNARARFLSSLVQVVLQLHARPQFWTGSERSTQPVRHVG